MSTCDSINASDTSRTRVRASAYMVCASSLLGVLDTAQAEIQFGGSLALTSDYVQQGLSQTRGEPTIQGGLHAQLDNQWTLGAWASGINRYPGAGADLELDVYVARAWTLTPEWVAAVTATHYFYPNDAPWADYEYDEVTASLGYRSMLYATVAWSPNYSERSYAGIAVERSIQSYELSANQPILGGWSGNAGVGYRDLSDLFDDAYWYGHVGLMHSAQRLTFHLTYTYVDQAARHLFGDERAAPTWSGTLIWRFGASD